MAAGLRKSVLAAVAIASGIMASAALAAPPDKAARLWSLVRELADDSYQGRQTGTPGYDRAAARIATELARLKLQPAGTRGYYQPIDFISQTFDSKASSASLTGPTGTTALAVPSDIYFRGSHAMPEKIEAPLVFAGYGLSMPDKGQDDFAGLDLTGKIVLVLSGGPADVAGSRKANARSERARILAERGALGMIALTTPKQIEIPWNRQIALSSRSSMMLADQARREIGKPFMAATFNPDTSEALFAGSGHSVAELAALADASKPLPKFDLPKRLAATIVAHQSPVHSANLVARLPGRDRRLASQNVVLSAHLDGLGIGEPLAGDSIYNGALDNAIGVSSVIAIARDIIRSGRRPRRSIIFLIATGEEVGLLGSRYFAANPTVPRASLVADINFDMPLPIFPLTSVTPIGAEESSLGAEAQRVSQAMRLPMVPDPFPDRNVFIRSDQYSFIRAGVPSLFMKFGFAAGTPEAEVEKAWRANIYHSPRDDAQQPVQPAEMVKFNTYVGALLRRVADNPVRPTWNSDSYFRHFAQRK